MSRVALTRTGQDARVCFVVPGYIILEGAEAASRVAQGLENLPGLFQCQHADAILRLAAMARSGAVWGSEFHMVALDLADEIDEWLVEYGDTGSALRVVRYDLNVVIAASEAIHGWLDD